MKNVLLWAVLTAVGAYLLGMFVAAVTSGSPVDWLTVQDPTGRPPRIIALLTLGPIILVGIIALVVRLRRRWNSVRSKKPDGKL
jgi:hypothetical protein